MYLIKDKFNEIPDSTHASLTDARRRLVEESDRGYSVYMVVDNHTRYEPKNFDHSFKDNQ